MFAEGEWKKIAGIVGVCALASILAKKRQKILDEKDAMENRMPIRERSIWEHPFVAYLLENGTIISVVALAMRIPFVEGASTSNQMSNCFRMFLRNLVIVEGSLAIQDFIYTKKLYSNIPWFSEAKRPRPNSVDLICDWLQCNFPAGIVNAATEVFLLTVQDPSVWKDAALHTNNKPVKVFPFLLKLAISRIIVDIVFHVAHRWMHDRSVYKQLHSRHHEHNKCALITNFHFTWMDIFLEAAFPAWLALGALDAIGKTPIALEAGLIQAYVVWFEAASHSGKEIPYATMFPPLSPLINAFTDTDRDNIKYHETHHNLVRCNYGITQWVDMLAGTHRLQKQPCEIGVSDLQVNEIPDTADEETTKVTKTI